MIQIDTINFIKNVITHMPSDWLKLTTHRLDIYNESLAKVEFLEKFQALEKVEIAKLASELNHLPTAFDYIRLGHPLSCVLEWTLSKDKEVAVENVISFSSQSMPIFAILRKNLFSKKKTNIFYTDFLPKHFDESLLKEVYGYKFELLRGEIEKPNIKESSILITSLDALFNNEINSQYDFILGIDDALGSVVIVNSPESESYVKEIQHVRRRESIAMTPDCCLELLKRVSGETTSELTQTSKRTELAKMIRDITKSKCDALVGSSGLSVQYAIMMGLVDYAQQVHKNKEIKFIVPPNCYGGTNDQARRVAACLENVEIIDLPVDSGKDMVSSVSSILDDVAKNDAVAYIIAEIPTNPRVEIPHLLKLQETLCKERLTSNQDKAVAPVFILDQTFCPNVEFLGESDYLAGVQTIAYVSGSKFPSGGLCTAGYCVSNAEGSHLMNFVEKHLKLNENEATDFQVETLIAQMPSMIERIAKAYTNTRAFVDHIEKELPEAKINFVSRELASQGFTPSVFSLDLPTKGESFEEREKLKRELNLKLINLMIESIPSESKFCVSYGQLKGCYWTIPATSTQGTTKEGDKDYIVRVSLSPQFDLEAHKSVFTKFCQTFLK
ncbi:cystathionine beta-synthase [Halobacteriovorax sp. GB3]|uniref:cystathionine beta-synthase n=1 Tax=Halobacteriovorax sp. GB3 TaxID=2719615 RepID=UPI0023621F48|nr:cystathionine beta-synthase [Halobacteriovorax sp. GB3]MDD0851662.1 cystathionine beta-synthase [Halobacteriovorax sp. GB3]